jgi:hypothetical protein
MGSVVGTIAVLLFGCVTMSAAAVETKTVVPKKLDGTVINPGKGWVCYGKPSPSRPAETKLCSLGYNRFEWGTLEPKEGVFDWAPIDSFIKAWAEQGKQVAFGIMIANTHSNAKDGYTTPKWVFKAGASERVQTIKQGEDAMKGNPGVYHMPGNFHDPILLKKLENFIKALAKRYDGHASVAFIDIRSYENWGEGYNTDHIMLHKKYFKKTWLCQSTQRADYAEWCAQRGIACRRDGIGGSQGQELKPAAGRVPAIFEFWGPVGYMKKRGWWKEGELIPGAVEVGKPTYVELVRSSPEFVRDYRHIIDKVTNRIGFHFVLEKAEYPASIKKGQAADIALAWMNKGVSRIFVPCVTKLALIDAKDKVVAVANVEGSDPATWLPDKSTTETSKVTFAGANLRGPYKLAIGLGNSPVVDTAVFRIGIDTPMVDKWHVLGPVQID